VDNMEERRHLEVDGHVVDPCTTIANAAGLIFQLNGVDRCVDQACR
jgi:hypothetical protein